MILIVVLAGVLFTVSHRPRPTNNDAPLIANSEGSESVPVMLPAVAPTIPPIPTPPKDWAGELPVAGGTVFLSADGPNKSVRKVSVGPFAIAETEVTNEQYQEFILETGRQAPPHWSEQLYPPGTATEPVTQVTWQQAADYCAWLSVKLGTNVRLPTEAEWELAAKGESGFNYPWGNEWNEYAAASAETTGQIRAVKSYPSGRSPVGAYEMAGNVWEWVGDDVIDAAGRPIMSESSVLKIAKGGAANEPRRFIGTWVRALLPSDKPRRYLGFRYVIVRENSERPD
ncbi:MAG TPA: SUMF1/EgtB/PvdO family nonheme iron enzyme [Blastocatellia bacterium]|nr:SUMF1/EgtB/PvdO family nonheme iron enzyme [Blastocatellia bacterium]